MEPRAHSAWGRRGEWLVCVCLSLGRLGPREVSSCRCGALHRPSLPTADRVNTQPSFARPLPLLYCLLASWRARVPLWSAATAPSPALLARAVRRTPQPVRSVGHTTPCRSGVLHTERGLACCSGPVISRFSPRGRCSCFGRVGSYSA